MKITPKIQTESPKTPESSGEIFGRDVTTGPSGAKRTDVLSYINALKDNRSFLHKALGFIIEDSDKINLTINFREVKKGFEKYKAVGIEIPEEIAKKFEYKDGTPVIGGPGYLDEAQANELNTLAEKGEALLIESRNEKPQDNSVNKELPSLEAKNAELMHEIDNLKLKNKALEETLDVSMSSVKWEQDQRSKLTLNYNKLQETLVSALIVGADAIDQRDKAIEQNQMRDFESQKTASTQKEQDNIKDLRLGGTLKIQHAQGAEIEKLKDELHRTLEENNKLSQQLKTNEAKLTEVMGRSRKLQVTNRNQEARYKHVTAENEELKRTLREVGGINKDEQTKTTDQP